MLPEIIVNTKEMVRKLYNSLLKYLIVKSFSNNFILIVHKFFATDNIQEKTSASNQSSHRESCSKEMVYLKFGQIPRRYLWKKRYSSFTSIFPGFCLEFKQFAVVFSNSQNTVFVFNNASKWFFPERWGIKKTLG